MTKIHWAIGIIVCIILGILLAFYIGSLDTPQSVHSILENPSPSPTTLPLEKYKIENLKSTATNANAIKITKELEKTDQFTAYQFTFKASGGKMTGQLTLPAGEIDLTKQLPTILMIRGFVPPSSCETGIGTKNGAAAFATAGFITVAPDFLSCGESDPEPKESWEARFIKPVQVIELLSSIEKYGVPLDQETAPFVKIGPVGIWGHSNGGQIALSVLQALEEPIPTTLWAPVTAPFPYSILFFSDEADDEGKELRKWLSIFERDYDVFDFTVTQHLERLRGPIQLHHGSADEAAPKAWSDEFVGKIKIENSRRAADTPFPEPIATASASINQESGSAEVIFQPMTNLEEIDLTYFEYPGADHNMTPYWDEVVQRDIEFFIKNLPN
ncbi:MAG: hypothetical protein WAU07_03195 [Microgenomates group bacterium]